MGLALDGELREALMRGQNYQITLIIFAFIATVLFGIFLYRELYPEYKTYQNAYIELEKFRSTYTGVPPPSFERGIKQIVIEPDNQGPVEVDRCISCHVALKLPHFSETKIARDINGNIRYDASGIPVQVPNEDYIWKNYDRKIAELIQQGDIKEADRLQDLKTSHVGEHVYDMTKVLHAHPLIGRETRAFEYHPVEEYGCTTCHNGNGRGLTTQKAHGPIFDEQYEAANEGFKPQFLQNDPKNDPLFSFAYNAKPGHDLLFQTTPLFVGSIIQAKCMQCHESSAALVTEAGKTASIVKERRLKQHQDIVRSYDLEKEHLRSLVTLYRHLKEKGYEQTVSLLNRKSEDYALLDAAREHAETQEKMLRGLTKNQAQEVIEEKIVEVIGSKELVHLYLKRADLDVDTFVNEHLGQKGAQGALFKKYAAVNFDDELIRHVMNTKGASEQILRDQRSIGAMANDVDFLTRDYQRGEALFLSQACYACHRIAGFSRGGVGPELTQEGLVYPWFVKESIVWPQADLKTSTMPNFHLDHIELEDLMAYLMAQTGQRKRDSETKRKIFIQQWEAGAKLPFEEKIPPHKITDLTYAMTVFATEGCAACHRLKGYESSVGFAVEKGRDPTFDEMQKQSAWFARTFPEMARGSEIVQAIDVFAEEIDRRIVDGVREEAILEKIENRFPDAIISFYDQFRYALRAKNHYYQTLADQATTLDEKRRALADLKDYKDRVLRVMKMYVQEYGLGRVIGPRPNWSGIYRSDKWLMEHFQNPQSHVARSIMPAMPFDDTKFYALTYMLDILGKRNRDEVRAIWEHDGFNPEKAYEIHCAQCHGDYLQGNGPVSEWIYPIPKNLRNAEFLRNLTKKRARSSIIHGIKGGPMPPWGEVATDKEMADGIPVLTIPEIDRIVNWIFSSLPGGGYLPEQEEIPKWQYGPEDVLRELEREGDRLRKKEVGPPELSALSKGEGYIASLSPVSASSLNQDIFTVRQNPEGDVPQTLYYIKEKYYTRENIESGKQYFVHNCAVCHGKEGDGTGARAETMQDAKPRMLTNINWSETRDDLRFLRSIKYGVPGTAMLAWGDQTTSLQRLQLVMYIRSLSSEKLIRERLANTLYHIFNEAQHLVEMARIKEYAELSGTERRLNEIREMRERIAGTAQSGSVERDKVVTLYREELTLRDQIDAAKTLDSKLVAIVQSLQKEKEIFAAVGNALIRIEGNGPVFDEFLALLQSMKGRYSMERGAFSFRKTKLPDKELEQLLSTIDEILKELQARKDTLEGRIASASRLEKNKELENEIISLKQLQNRLQASFTESERQKERQQELFNEFRQAKEKLTL